MILNLLNEIEMDIDSVMPIVFEAIRKYGRPPAEFSGYLDEFYIKARNRINRILNSYSQVEEFTFENDFNTLPLELRQKINNITHKYNELVRLWENRF